MRTDERYMRLALQLAKKAEGLTHPNPAVGAVVVKGGRVVGTGYHRRCGLPHAEVNALCAAGGRARGATLYVTLEPCNHFGRTPPCTDAVVKSGVKRVVVAMADPNPLTNGRGIRKLRQHGIRVECGVLKDEARLLNAPWIKHISKGLPYVTVKVAESIDGKIATRTGDSKWITADDSRRYVHSLRRRVDAVMVGATTATRDDPLLLSRTRGARQPVRIIVDSRLSVPSGARLFSSARMSRVIVATTSAGAAGKARRLEEKGVAVLRGGSRRGRVDLRALLKMLAKAGIVHILVEGGGELVASLVEEKLVDKFLFFIAPKIVGGRDAVTAVEGAGADTVRAATELSNMKVRRFSRDILVEAEPG